MKRIQTSPALPTLLSGLLLFSMSFGNIYASTATSGAFRIDKPQVIIQGGLNGEGMVGIAQRSSAQDALEFQKTGVLIQRAAGSSLKATVGMQLIEIGETNMNIPNVPMYVSSKTAYEYIHVRRSSDLHRSVTYTLLQKLDQNGTSDSISLALPIDLSRKNSFLGTLEIFAGSY